MICLWCYKLAFLLFYFLFYRIWINVFVGIGKDLILNYYL